MRGEEPVRTAASGVIADAPPEWNRLTGEIIGAAMEVHSTLGPGLLERIYEQAFAHELKLRGLEAERQAPIRLHYKGLELGDQYLDLVVGKVVIVEIKSVDRVSEVHLHQLVSYLRSSRIPLGLLINFNVPHLKSGIYRRAYSRSTPVPEVFISEDLPPRASVPSASAAIS